MTEDILSNDKFNGILGIGSTENNGAYTKSFLEELYE